MFSKDKLYVNQHNSLVSVSYMPKFRISISREIKMGCLSIIYEQLVLQMFIMPTDCNLEYISI